ncbi:MAG: elongation factor P 5-aminopentanone reductase [Bacillota bacterium]
MPKHVLVLGASGAIGQQIVKDLSESGHSFSLHYHKNIASLQTLMNDLPVESVLEMIQADLSSSEGIDQLLSKVQFTPDVIVFSQGQASYGLFTNLSGMDMTALLSVHVEALWKVTQHFLPSMLQKRIGNIIVISSIWGKRGASHEVAYSTVKGAQIAFVKALAKEVGANNIRINAITPGFIDTDMNEQLSVAERAALLEEIPLQRFGKVDDVSRLSAFLVSDASSYITGEVLGVSGGWHI